MKPGDSIEGRRLQHCYPVCKVPALVKMGLPLEMLLYLQECYKKPDLGYTVMFQTPDPLPLTQKYTMTAIFVVAELHGQLLWL